MYSRQLLCIACLNERVTIDCIQLMNKDSVNGQLISSFHAIHWLHWLIDSVLKWMSSIFKQKRKLYNSKAFNSIKLSGFGHKNRLNWNYITVLNAVEPFDSSFSIWKLLLHLNRVVCVYNQFRVWCETENNKKKPNNKVMFVTLYIELNWCELPIIQALNKQIERGRITSLLSISISMSVRLFSQNTQRTRAWCERDNVCQW